jgi:hypothetical protein
MAAAALPYLPPNLFAILCYLSSIKDLTDTGG